MSMLFIAQPNQQLSTLTYLQQHFADPQWTQFRAAVAFVKQSGVKHIAQALHDFAQRGEAEVICGLSMEGSSFEGLQSMLASLNARGKLWVFYNELSVTFHPKVYMFRNQTHADVLIGSSNATEGGLFSNYEASCGLSLDLGNPAHVSFLQQIDTALDHWSMGNPELSKLLTYEFLDQLVANGYVPRETEQRARARTSAKRHHNTTQAALFGREPALRPPVPTIAVDELTDESDELLVLENDLEEYDEELTEDDFEVRPPEPVPAQDGNYRVFVMTLRQTDVGYGKTNAKRETQARSPEVFIPLVARNFDPDFWGWQKDFVADPKNPIKFDRRGVKVMLGGSIIHVSMMTWPKKSDFRLRGQAIRLAAKVGDILKIERTDGSGGFNYYVNIIPQGTTEYDEQLNRCNQEVKSKNSDKRWGYYS